LKEGQWLSIIESIPDADQDRSIQSFLLGAPSRRVYTLTANRMYDTFELFVFLGAVLVAVAVASYLMYLQIRIMRFRRRRKRHRQERRASHERHSSAGRETVPSFD
jgi:hypothetical protein